MITPIKSKHGPSYKFKVEATIRGVHLHGETLPFHMALYDEVTLREAASILEGRLFRGEYGQAVTCAQKRLVENALLIEMKRIFDNL